MKRLPVLLPIVMLFCAVMACQWSGGPSKPGTTTPVTTPSPQTPSLDDEAVAAVKELWEQHTTKCGDSYYGFEDNFPFIAHHQYKEVSFVVKRSPLTEADRLNGILWNGEVVIATRLTREKIKGGEWAEWQQSNGGEAVGATKRESGWSVVQLLHITNMKKVKCSEVTE